MKINFQMPLLRSHKLVGVVMIRSMLKYGAYRRHFVRANRIGVKNVHTAANELEHQMRKKPTIRDLVKAPIFKSIFLTIVFGTAVVGLIDSRREFEHLEQTYKSKFVILEEIISKLEAGEYVDIHHELKLVNMLTKNNYNSVTDIELDDQLNEILKMAESEEHEIRKPQETNEPEIAKDDSRSIETNKFL